MNKFGVCNSCFEMKTLQYHHVFVQRYYGRKNNDSKVLLCEDCHRAIHKILPSRKLHRRAYIEIYKTFILERQALNMTTEEGRDYENTERIECNVTYRQHGNNL